MAEVYVVSPDWPKNPDEVRVFLSEQLAGNHIRANPERHLAWKRCLIETLSTCHACGHELIEKEAT